MGDGGLATPEALGSHGSRDWARRTISALLMVALLAGVSVGGLVLGRAGGADKRHAAALGTRLGNKAGRAAGSRQGYAVGYERGRKVGYQGTYSVAYHRAYAKASR